MSNSLHRTILPKGWSRLYPGHSECVGGRRVRSPEYNSYDNMLRRCYYSCQNGYQHYEDVYVHSSWVNSFYQFLEDMGPRPEGTTLDRINPSGHYTPGNCRWASRSVQASNKRRVIDRGNS